MIHGATLLTVGAALASALAFGLSTSLQHRAATSLAEVAPRRLLAQLVKHPDWRAGIAVSIAAFGLHAVALGAGPLTLVQPLIISGVVFAVLFRATLDRRRPSGRELGWVALTWAGLVAFIAGTAGTASTHPPQHAVLVTAVLTVSAAGAARQGGRARTPERRGLWLGVSAGILFGLVAAMIKLTAIAIAAGPSTGLLAIGWPLVVMLLTGLSAVALNQRAYQTTRLSVSMPVLNVVDVMVALGFAGLVLGELPGFSLGALAAQLLGLATLAWGVRELARAEEHVITVTSGPVATGDAQPDLSSHTTRSHP